MRIVLDLQGAQTASRFRGIGRYSLSFAHAIVRNRGEHDIILALSGLLPDSIAPIRAAFNGLLPQQNICVWHAPGPVLERHPGNAAQREVAERMREAFLASLAPDIIHICSLFEGYVDDAVTSIGRLDRSTPVSVSLYDLIPLLNPAHYLQPNPDYAAYYQRKLDDLKKADLLLAISEFSRQEGIAHLALPESRFINVSSAIDSHFRPLEIQPAGAAQLRQKFGLTRPFVLYTGGSDDRKNLPRLIQAFAALPTALREAHQLVFAGLIHELAHFKKLAESAGLAADALCCTGYVSDDELVQLYNLCKLFVFPSWHEGFGLPALEAMACGVPVIGANGSSLPEVIALDAALFDPFDSAAISAKMAQALQDDALRNTLRAHGLQQAKRFSWDVTAKRALAAFAQIQARRGHQLPPSAKPWASTQEQLAASYQRLVSAIADVAAADARHTDADIAQIANCLEGNQRQMETVLRSALLPQRLSWRIEGPFDSSYSLALVNRETARALASLGHDVALHSTEGPGDFPADIQFLTDNPDLAKMHARAAEVAQAASPLTSRNLYPPRVQDMQSQFNFLHGYAWEESALPHQWVEAFNSSLQGIAVTSQHVYKVLIDNGVTVPIAVTGNGVDHWERLMPDSKLSLVARKFRFLHVSSCFPRKGADAMLEAYGRAFRAKDNVTLVIKTFANPHNEIHRWLDAARAGDAEFPDVQILEGDYSDAKLKAIYQHCDALVAPSRAEGFGLPMAEAMLSSLAVITTGWSGQVDFCTPQTAWLVDYHFEPAATHFGLYSSVWAAPDVSHLAKVMREVYETPPAERAVRIAAGRKLLQEQFCWAHVAQRLVTAARTWASLPELAAPRIGWVTSWNTRCGIATYSQHLVNNLPQPVTVLAAHTAAMTAEDETYVDRCWSAGDSDALSDLRLSIDHNRLDVLVIQFNYGFFDLPTLASFITEQIDAGRIVMLVMHATTDPAHAPHKTLRILVPALARCHRVLVHAPGDLNRLKGYGLVENVALFPHGILDYSPPVKAPRASNTDFVIASYGFFLPHKGLLELIDAVALLRRSGMRVVLHMVNAEYPAAQSSQIIAQAKSKVADLGLQADVSICTAYLDDTDSLQRLANADLLVFPYQDTAESASGAVRYGLATGRPVAVTPMAIFDDVASAVYTLPGSAPEQLAIGIRQILEQIAAGAEAVHAKQAEAASWCEAHRYGRLGQRLYAVMQALTRQQAADSAAAAQAASGGQ
jgi:glycosyltransferase involved in cell wall biosynthesis